MSEERSRMNKEWDKFYKEDQKDEYYEPLQWQIERNYHTIFDAFWWSVWRIIEEWIDQ